MSNDFLLFLALFTVGIIVGILSRYGPTSGWVALLFPLLLPTLAIVLTIAYPFSEAGACLIYASPSFSTLYALYACRYSQARRLARIGFVLASVQVFLIFVLMVLAEFPT